MFHVSRPLSCLILTLIVDRNGKRCNSGLAFVELFARYISARLKNLSLSSGSLKGNHNLKNFFCLRLRRSRCDYITPLDFTRSVSYSLNLVVVRQRSGKKHDATISIRALTTIPEHLERKICRDNKYIISYLKAKTRNGGKFAGGGGRFYSERACDERLTKVLVHRISRPILEASNLIAIVPCP